MSRPQKQGLDYFPLDVFLDDDVELLEYEHGLEGFALLIKLYQKIYENGYYLYVDERRIKLLSRRINVDKASLEAVIESCLSYNIFDKELYKKYKILTSKGIQSRYLAATERRSTVKIIDNFFLLNIEDYKDRINVDILHTETPVEQGLMYTETPTEQELLHTETPVEQGLMYTESTQSKVKKSKVNIINNNINNNSGTFSEKPTKPKKQTKPDKTPSAEPAALAPKNVFELDRDNSRNSELYKKIKSIFEADQLQNRFTNYPKEGKAIKQLIKKARARSPDSPDIFLIGMIEQFRELRTSGDKFWNQQPFLPSALNSSGIFDRVLNAAQVRYQEDLPASGFDMKEVMFF